MGSERGHERGDAVLQDELRCWACGKRELVMCRVANAAGEECWACPFCLGIPPRVSVPLFVPFVESENPCKSQEGGDDRNRTGGAFRS
jgi:hypothetical protein